VCVQLDFEPSSVSVISTIMYNTNKYFSIELDKPVYAVNIFRFLGGVTVMDGIPVPISKQEVTSLLLLLSVDYNRQYTDLYISVDSLYLNNVRDTFGKPIFNNHKNVMGWLVFIDLCNIANWSHQCEYWFVISSNEILKRCDEQWKPESIINLEKI